MGAYSKMSSKNGITAPVFDLSGVGYGWQKKFMKVNAQIAHVSVLSNSDAADDASEADKNRVLMAKMEALSQSDELIERRDALLCEVLRDVPRAWLIPNAPEVLDWSNVESLDYLAKDRMEDLQKALGEATNPKN